MRLGRLPRITPGSNFCLFACHCCDQKASCIGYPPLPVDPLPGTQDGNCIPVKAGLRNWPWVWARGQDALATAGETPALLA